MEGDTRNFFLLGYAIIQYFYGDGWEKDSDGLGLENEED